MAWAIHVSGQGGWADSRADTDSWPARAEAPLGEGPYGWAGWGLTWHLSRIPVVQPPVPRFSSALPGEGGWDPGSELGTLKLSGPPAVPQRPHQCAGSSSPSPKNCAQWLPAGPAGLDALRKEGSSLLGFRGTCPPQRQWDSLVEPEGRAVT